MWRDDDFGGKDDLGTGVSCSLCGEGSHPTRDCPMRGQPGMHSRIDAEVSSFLDEVSAGKGSHMRPGFSPEELDVPEHRDAYEELLCILEGRTFVPKESFRPSGQWADQRDSPYGPPPGCNPYGPPGGVLASPYGPPPGRY